MYFIHIKQKFLTHCFDMDKKILDKTKYVVTSSKYSNILWQIEESWHNMAIHMWTTCTPSLIVSTLFAI
jgi:hypothetical protein